LQVGAAHAILREMATPRAGCKVSHFCLGDHELAVASFAVPSAPARLSPVERSLLQGLLRGQSEPELAHARRRSLATIRHQVESIYRKLGAHSRAELVLRCSGE